MAAKGVLAARVAIRDITALSWRATMEKARHVAIATRAASTPLRPSSNVTSVEKSASFEPS